MKRISQVAILFSLTVITIVFTGCLETFYPFFTKEDVVYDPSLLGTWSYHNDTEKGSILFQPIPASRKKELEGEIREISSKGYFVTYRDTTGQAVKHFFVFLAKLGNEFYLDRFPAQFSELSPVAPLYQSHYLRLHSCLRLQKIDARTIELRMVEGSFMDKQVERNQIRIRYARENPPGDKRIVVATTAQLKDYLKKYGSDPGAYNPTYSFVCIKTGNK